MALPDPGSGQQLLKGFRGLPALGPTGPHQWEQEGATMKQQRDSIKENHLPKAGLPLRKTSVT